MVHGHMETPFIFIHSIQIPILETNIPLDLLRVFMSRLSCPLERFAQVEHFKFSAELIAQIQTVKI